MKKSPLGTVKDKFGDKAKLVEAIKAFQQGELWLGRTQSDRGGDKGLGHVSNAKLLKLHQTFTAVKEKFGTRDKLVGAILDLEKRTKDEGYKKRISAYPVPRLWDMYKSAEKRKKASEGGKAKPAAAKAPKAAPAKAAKAAPAAKKTAKKA
jgi:hypothetical protein